MLLLPLLLAPTLAAVRGGAAPLPRSPPLLPLQPHTIGISGFGWLVAGSSCAGDQSLGLWVVVVLLGLVLVVLLLPGAAAVAAAAAATRT